MSKVRHNTRGINKLREEGRTTLLFTDVINVEEIIIARLSKISLYEKCTNSNEIFPLRLQISYPCVKTTYYLFFINHIINNYISYVIDCLTV